MKHRIIYQIFFRPFTPEGTLAAAKEKLSHIASLGIDTVYLTSAQRQAKRATRKNLTA